MGKGGKGSQPEKRGKDLRQEKGKRSQGGKGLREERVSTGKGWERSWGGKGEDLGRKGLRGKGSQPEKRGRILGRSREKISGGERGSPQGKVGEDLREEQREDLSGGKRP